MQNPALIIFTGLPGAGKSSIAQALSKELNFAVFSKDRLEATLVRSGLAEIGNQKLGYSGYELLTELAEASLQAGVSVGLDSVCGRSSIRKIWSELASSCGASFIIIECICSDENLHRKRLENRVRGIDGWHELDWAEVERVRSYYEAWEQERLVLDSIQPLDKLLHNARQYLNKTELKPGSGTIF